MFGHNTVKAIGEGDIIADIKFQDKTTRIRLTQVMHVPGADGKILSLKMLDQKGFETHITRGHIHIMKVDEIYTEASLGEELYEVKMKIIPPQCNGPEVAEKAEEVGSIGGQPYKEV